MFLYVKCVSKIYSICLDHTTKLFVSLILTICTQYKWVNWLINRFKNNFNKTNLEQCHKEKDFGHIYNPSVYHYVGNNTTHYQHQTPIHWIHLLSWPFPGNNHATNYAKFTNSFHWQIAIQPLIYSSISHIVKVLYS